MQNLCLYSFLLFNLNKKYQNMYIKRSCIKKQKIRIIILKTGSRIFITHKKLDKFKIKIKIPIV